MTPEQYWDGDCTLVRAYRKAELLRQQRQNSWMWMQGLYIYDALIRLAPYLNANKPQKPEPYPEKPYPITDEEMAQREEEENEKKLMNASAAFGKFVSETKNENKGGDDDGRRRSSNTESDDKGQRSERDENGQYT